MKKIVTQDNLDINPDLVEQGVQVGDEIELGPACDENGNELASTHGDDKEEPPAEGGPGSSQPPGSQPGKP